MAERRIDRHKTPRSYSSGAQKRNKAKEKKRRGDDFLENTQKLSNYFCQILPDDSRELQGQSSRAEVPNICYLADEENDLTQAASKEDKEKYDERVGNVHPRKSGEEDFTANVAEDDYHLTADEREEHDVMDIGEADDQADDKRQEELVDTAVRGQQIYHSSIVGYSSPAYGDEEAHLSSEAVDCACDFINAGVCNDIGLWPQTFSSEFIDFWATEGSKKLQNCTSTLLEKSVSQVCKIGKEIFERKCSKNIFSRRNKNGESVNRSWLCFSPSTGKVYCYVCKLITPQKENLSGEGFGDWKHVHARIAEHEISKSHLTAVTTLANRGERKGSISAHLLQMSDEIHGYWKHVLMRVVSTIKFLAERGLAFRGENELLNSTRNGNFLGIIELIAKFHPFLASHIKEHGGTGRGKTNYLSSTIVEELIQLMGQRTQQEIIARIKLSKYYSVSVDSTPDEAHIDQLTIIIRYLEGSSPKERFLTFLPNCGHTGYAIANALLQFSQQHTIEIRDCRGQAYDNAANMVGKYKGMQTYVKEKNKFAELIPCCGHSLNLVGKAAANACPKAVNFFQFVQQIYVFFTASTHRYKILANYLSQSGSKYLVPKNLSDTRWACRADAIKALVQGYAKIKEALVKIGSDQDEKDIVKNEANGLARQMSSLEISLLSVFWKDILNRFDATNKALQHPKLLLQSAVDMLKSLKNFVESKRDHFLQYEQEAKHLSDTEEYCEEHSRRHKRNVRLNPLDYAKEPGSQFSPSEKFKVESFLPVIDRISTSLSDRISSYEVIAERFGILGNLAVATPQQISSAARNLANIYVEDLDAASLENELQQFAYLVKNSTQAEHEDFPTELCMYKMVLKDPFKSTFPNIEILLRMYLVLMVTNCSGERSFSKMKLIKNRLRSTMGQERLSHLCLLSIEHDILGELDFSDLIQEFAMKKSRKVHI